VYAEGRPLTLAGTLQGTVMARDRIIPFVEADTLYLWDESPDTGDHYPYALRPRGPTETYSPPYPVYQPWQYHPWYWPDFSLGLGYCRGCGGWLVYPALVWPGIGFYFRYGH